MNKITLRTLAALTIALAGCVVTSVYPFYTDTDLVFDPALVGQWVGVEKDGTTKDKLEFKKNGDKEYVVALEENHFLEDKYVAHLFKLKEQLFLDFCPLERHDPDFIPVHQIMKITVTGTRMKTIGIKYDWLTQLLTQNPHALRHVVTKNPKDANGKAEEHVVLTATTKELQEFVLKNLDTKDAWTEPDEYQRGEAKP